jgi:glycosyltransferase involved in cell wall biosynthesis
MSKVCILTSVHNRHDTRIFLKEIPSLIMFGYEVSVIVADGKGDSFNHGYILYDVGFRKNRFLRILFASVKIFSKAVYVNADIYHFHDPELIHIGLLLVKRGKKVIYDVHEDVPEAILSKEWIIKPLRRIISFFFEYSQTHASKHFSYIIAATPFIRDKFLSFSSMVIDINNYPLLGELDNLFEWRDKEKAVCYIGTINRVRGISYLIKAMQNVDGRLYLAGPFDYESYRVELTSLDGWSKVTEMGNVNRVIVKEILSKSVAGLVVFWSEPNHINSQPNKMFEYMSAGIPIIGSNFKYWKTIIETNGCGICVDPMNPREIADAINFLLNNQDIAKEMGKCGRNAVENKYNWTFEGKKLFDIYKTLVS